MNRLEGSASPYLRQHAADPVEWWPWCEEAFAYAAEANRPVLLSSGYSACHWCHVMQRESFRDPETADRINRDFVAVKVDRELRPDVDALYQDYVSALIGSAGWPLTVWLTPDKLPLYGGTYFPKTAVSGIPSFSDAADAVLAAWHENPGDIARTAQEARAFLQDRIDMRPEDVVNRPLLDYAVSAIVSMQDLVNGGLKGRTKFPHFTTIEACAAYDRLVPGDPDLRRYVESAMLAIVRGGIFDQVGGGMHRYTVDEAWRTPHFEKMLCDNALLLSALAAAAPMASSEQVRAVYARAVRATSAFLERDLLLPSGWYAAALDADTDHVEGATYTWSPAQLEAALDPVELAWARANLGADDATEAEPTTLVRPACADADPAMAERVLCTLAAARASRPMPGLDDKALTSWNAMAARGLMDAGTAFGDGAMSERGVELVRLMMEGAARDDGVVREPSDASVAHVRLLDDAAHLVAAMITAHDITGDAELLQRAQDRFYDTLERFGEEARLFSTTADTDLPVRPRDGGDGTAPSGTSTMAENAVRLYRRTDDEWFAQYAGAALTQLWGVIDYAPEQAGRALVAAAALFEQR